MKSGSVSPTPSLTVVRVPVVEAPPPIEGGSNRPLPLDRADRLWIVQAGYADVFAVRAGVRGHLFRAEAGEYLFGCAPREAGGLIAVGALGSRFLVEPVETALDDPMRIEPWVRRVAEATAGADRAWPDLVLCEGGHRIEAARRAAAPAHGLLWVEVTEGALDWCGEAPLAPGSRIPLAAPAWLEGEAGAALAVTTAPPTGELAAALGTLNAAALDVLSARLTARAVEEARRQRERTGRAETGMAAALLRLASVSRRDPDEPPSDDPLAFVLDLLCDRLGHAGPRPRSASGGGTPRERLDALLREAGLHARPVTLASGWWRRDGAPLLAWLDEAEPVALIPNGRRWRLRGRGIDRIVDARLAARLDTAEQLYPSLPNRKVLLADLVGIVGKGVGGDVRRLAAMGLLGALLGLAGPIATGLLFADIVPLGDRRGVLEVIACLLALALGQTAFSFVEAVALLRLEARLDANLQAALVGRLLRLPAAFFRGYSVGDLTERTLGLQEACQIVTGAALSALFGAVFALTSLGVMLTLDWRIGLVALAPIALTVAATVALAYGQLVQERKRTRLRGRLDGFVLQLMVGIGKLRAGAAETRAMAEWARRDVPLRRAFVAGRRFAAAQTTAQALLPALGLVTIYAAAASFVTADAGGAAGPAALSAAAFAAFSAAFGQLTGALTGAAMALTHLLAAVPLVERTRPLLDAVPEALPDGETLPTFAGGIELRRVSFRYGPGTPLVLNDLSLTIRPGEFVALVGGSGSGKSTIMRLLLGFERPETGEVYYDGRASDRIDLASLRRSFGVVLQHGRITAGSIHENILIGTGLALDDAWAAARLVNLDADIEAMPMGMHTVLNDGGQALSGGQRQRILLARALVQRPKVLLLDEATSALDNRTQAVVTDTLASLSVTRIVIAHRLSTIRDVDRIVVVERGRVVETGSYSDLMAQDGPFAALVRRQLL